MIYQWRTTLENSIKETYITHSDDWFEIVASTSGSLNIIIVSKAFISVPFFQRKAIFEQLTQSISLPLSLGMLSLYTPEEATSLALSRPSLDTDNPLYSWFDLATQAANSQDTRRIIHRELRIPATVTFYSFKGGVGRTTALIQTAAILARRGRKVVAVDLDLEAPGLSSALGFEDQTYGIVDYFYERTYLPEDTAPAIAITDIFAEVPISNATGSLFVVPAGPLTLDYIAKVDDLREGTVTERGKNLWSTFYQEITTQLQPDVILVDSRTGLNEWGAFSLLSIADKAIVFLYPDTQNRRGISLITQALSGILPTYFVFSPVPAVGEISTNLVAKHWQNLQQHSTFDRISTSYMVSESSQPYQNSPSEEDDDEGNAFTDPIIIPYLNGIALADSYPVEELSSYYIRIANIIDEDTNTARIETILTNNHDRREIIQSLEFPEIDAAQNQNLDALFQRTTDFDRFLDNTTCLIRGRKGTGKTALYRLLVAYYGEARKLSRKRLDPVICISGHGSLRQRPEKNEFLFIHQLIEQKQGSWEAFWRAYFFVRLRQEGLLSTFFHNTRGTKYQPIFTLLNQIEVNKDTWRKEYTDTLAAFATNQQYNLLLKDALDEINSSLAKSKIQNQDTLWLLYDDLDVDLREDNELRNKVLTGLFQFVQACDVRQLKKIGFKIFLREDIWRRIIFDNKSHFNGRDITLKWTRLDFLRLALRQAQQSDRFKGLVDRFSPVENIDQANEDTIERALQLLWGSRRERNAKSKNVSRWIYERLTDSSGTTFPRSLNILLKTAKTTELATDDPQPSSTDNRLLRQTSLIEGLKEASQLRCEELRNEYKDLDRFFDALIGLNILPSRSDLNHAWQKTVQRALPEFKDFNTFIDFLITIGLIEVTENRDEQRYRFAEIYTHGFKINRGTRKY